LPKPSKKVRSLRKTRPFHRFFGLVLSLLILISAGTGIFLSLKKEAEFLQPSSRQAEVTSLEDWLGIDQLALKAQDALLDSLLIQNITIDRLDVRPDKGLAKVRFEDDWEVQIEGSTGKILNIGKRHADWIERIHDGSIISDGFKLVSMNLLGFGIIFLSLSGLWLWYGPKLVKRSRARK
jgi:uncharacterized iron-regulated membrane protein